MQSLLTCLLLLLSACSVQDTGEVEEDSADSADLPWTGPEYDGTCPEFESGLNTGFVSGDQERSMRIRLPDNPQGAALLFVWHWLGGNARQAVSYLELKALAENEHVIVVVPESDGASSEWHFDAWPAGNPDLALFDDVIACMHSQFDIPEDRIYSTGFSAGGMWTTYLILYRSETLAAAAPLSGGFYSAYYQSPDVPLPVALTWGGSEDVYANYSFDLASQDFSSDLQADGHFVLECEHTGGHTFPEGVIEYNWRFFADHPRGVSPEPYADGLPDDFPSWCQIGTNTGE